MNIADIPLFSMLKGRLGYLSERERIVAQNVANSDTPGYRSGDLKPFTFHVAGAGGQMAPTASTQAVTQAGHMQATSTRKTPMGGPFKTTKTQSSETTLDGNSVVLEEEMLRMADARMNYDAAIGFYQKSLGLLRMASRAPGRG